MIVYFDEVNISVAENILEIWQRLKNHYSALAQMTKDVLSISVAGVEVEQLFSMIWDVVSY